MLRLLTIELQKLRFNKSAKVISIVYFALICFIAFIVSIEFDFGGVKFRVADQGIFNFPYIWHFNAWMAAWLKIFFAIVIVSIVSNEYSYRTLKQNLIDGLSKREFLTSKFLTVLLFSVVSTIFLFVVSLILGLIFSDYNEIGIIFSDLQYMFAYFLKLLCFFSFCMFGDSMRVLFGSGNDGKCREVVEIGRRFSGVEVVEPRSILDSSCESTKANLPDIDETADTYYGNALLKAQAFYAWSGISSFADDSGLEVKSLDGAPGLYSARYAMRQPKSKLARYDTGQDCSPVDNINKMLLELKGVEDRAARFVCTICLFNDSASDGKAVLETRGELSGRIAHEPFGDGGFGYDPIFIPDGSDKTLAQLKGEGQLVKTHRVLAVEKFFTELLKLSI